MLWYSPWVVRASHDARYELDLFPNYVRGVDFTASLVFIAMSLPLCHLCLGLARTKYSHHI